MGRRKKGSYVIKVGETNTKGKGYNNKLVDSDYDRVSEGAYGLQPGQKRYVYSKEAGKKVLNPAAKPMVNTNFTKPADYPNQDRTLDPHSQWNVDMDVARQVAYPSQSNIGLFGEDVVKEFAKIYNIRKKTEFGATEEDTAPRAKRTLSDETKAKISKSQKERWAKKKAAKEAEGKDKSKNKKDKKENSGTKKPGTKNQGQGKSKNALSEEEKQKILDEELEREKAQDELEREKALEEARKAVFQPPVMHEAPENAIPEIEEPEIPAPEIEVPETTEPEIIWTPPKEDATEPEIEIPENEIKEQEAMIPEMEEIGQSEVIVDDTAEVVKLQNILDELDKNVPSLDTLKEEAELAGQKLTLEPAKQKAEDDDLLDIIAWMIATCNMNINMRNIAPQLGSDSEFRAAAHGKKKGEAKKNAGLIGGRGTGTVGNVPGGYMIPVEAIALTVRQMRQMVYELSAVQRAIKGGLSGMTVQQIYAILYRIYAWMKSVARGSRFIDSESWTDIYAVYLGIIPQVMTLASLSNSAPGTYNQPSLSTP